MLRRSGGSGGGFALPNAPTRQNRANAVYTGSGSNGVATYVYPGDEDYQRQLELQQNRLRSEEERENREMGENIAGNESLSIENLLVDARNSFLSIHRLELIRNGLSILHKQKGDINLHSIDFLALDLNDLEIKEVLKRYKDIPNEIVEKGESAIQLMEGVVRLSGTIRTSDAKELQAFSDKMGSTYVALQKLVDTDAIFTINNTLKQKARYIGLTEDEAKNWLTTWSHIDLAKWVTVIWGRKDEKTHSNLASELENFDLEIDSKDMHILNTAGEQKKVLELHQIFANHNLASYANPAIQKKFVEKLNKKMPKKNIFQQDMELSNMPRDTVQDWIDCFLLIREIARNFLNRAFRWGAQAPPRFDTYKKDKEAKRLRDVGDTVATAGKLSNDEKTQKRSKIFDVRAKAFEAAHHCWVCGMSNHDKNDCFKAKDPKHEDRNQENKPFNESVKGKQWMANKIHGPFVHAHFLLNGEKRIIPGNNPSDVYNCKYHNLLLSSVINDAKEVPIFNNENSTDYLSVFISLPITQTVTKPLQGVEDGGMDADAGVAPAVGDAPGKALDALLDSGCLVGDCMSQRIVDELNAAHLIVYINTTICSGFDNTCQSRFPSLLVNITFINELNLRRESFQTTVFILPRSPIELIIGRNTIKKQQFSLRTPSHFSEQTNLTNSQRLLEPFGAKAQESYRVQPPHQMQLESVRPVKKHAHTCTSILNSDSPIVDAGGPPVNKKNRLGVEIEDLLPTCSCSKAVPHGSCTDQKSCPSCVQKSPGNQMNDAGFDGLNDTPLLPTLPSSDTPPILAHGKTRGQSKKWLLQEDGTYTPVLVEKSGTSNVCSMTPLSMKPVESRPGTIPKWGIIATLIKQQEQLDVSLSQQTVDNSQDALCAFTESSEEIMDVDHVGDTTIDETLDTEHDVFNEFLPQGDDPNTDVLDLIQVEGTPSLKRRIRLILQRYRSVFATTLSPEPAIIPPFELEVDKEKWETFANRGPPRVQSPAKQAEILKQVDELLKAGIIEPSNASYYSQVILASKPDETWRFCIDYRKLNDCTRSASWPIPDIKQMFNRLGTHHSNLYGVMDLTSGYHQAPVSLGTRIFLAFICFCGIFQFRRLPFGPKRAPSYFQQMMASIVLIGLIYFICEMYLDDCIVHGNGEDQFCDRLEQVLARFQRHLILLKPSKCKFGLPKIDYCGREISKEGLSMSTKKVQKVLDFPKPQTAGDMKKFVGLTNYFHDYVHHHSIIMKPLHDMIQNYEKRTRGKALVWTQEGEDSFYEIIKEIEKNHTMFFPRDDCPIFLMTDACNFGIGGYCFQLVDNKEQPVAFVSKALSLTQYKWSILQKEAYAIYYALRMLRAILRDRRFTVQTDNRGLAFMKTDSNPMVYRWLVDVQEFDFNTEDILGKFNYVSDPISRLVANNMPADMIASLLPPTPIPMYLQILIGKVHSTVTGHHGVERTLRMLTTPSSADSNVTLITEHVPNLRSHVKRYIKLCPCCQKMSMLRVPIVTHPYTTSRYYPMECLNIDYIGPYPDKGYVFVIIDTFSRWVALYHAPEATGKNAAHALFQHFGTFGAPTQLRSDRGSHFVNTVIKEFVSLVGTQHCLTLAYSSQQNAIVERCNKEINRHIRSLTFESNSVDNYMNTLPIVQRILNASYIDHTKVKSSEIIFGNAINLDRGLFLPPLERPTQGQPLSEHMSNMLKFQDEVMAKAQYVFQRDDDLHMASFPKLKPTEFAHGSHVVVKYRGGSAPTRVHTSWKGPLRVISNDKSEYMLLDLITNKPKPYHASDMKTFIFDPLQTDPLEIARKDYLEFFVEEILEVTGNIKKVTTVEFLVKWVGYDFSHNSWEPYKNLRDVVVLHKYLEDNNLQNLIPKKFR
jgi:transposase InsO family protein